LSHTSSSETHSYTLSLHDALPISMQPGSKSSRPIRQPPAALNILQVPAIDEVDVAGQTDGAVDGGGDAADQDEFDLRIDQPPNEDRKSTRLNSSHLGISYAVFCLK